MASSGCQDNETIKGSVFRAFALWYERRFGRQQLAELVQGLPEQIRTGLDPGREGMPAMLREGCEQMAADLLRGLYKFLFQLVGSPNLYSKHIQKGWRSLHSSGEREFILKGPGEAESIIRDWHGHHPWLCLITHETMRCIFVAMGFQEVQVDRTQCVSNGNPVCRATLRFRKA